MTRGRFGVLGWGAKGDSSREGEARGERREARGFRERGLRGEELRTMVDILPG